MLYLCLLSAGPRMVWVVGNVRSDTQPGKYRLYVEISTHSSGETLAEHLVW